MNIIFATGGSGGHIFPALKIAQKLKREGHHILFVGALRFAEERLRREGFSFVILDVQGLNQRSVPAFFSFGFLMMKAIIRSMGILRSFKPEVVVGFGGYSSFPPVLAANLLGIPAMLHEQNVIPGKANRLSLLFSRQVALTFEESRKHISHRKTIWTGCPCNSERSIEPRMNLLTKFQLLPDRCTILVLGGSQGSRYLNEVFFEAIPYLQAKKDIQVIHMTGRTDYSLYAHKYAALKIPYHVCGFIDNIQDAYSVADLVIARAGAGTVCEIAAFHLPSILVPYPFAEGHQMANAKILENAKVAVVIEQKDLTRQKLVESIQGVLNQGLTSDVVHERTKDFFLDHSVDQLAQAILSLK